MALAIGRVHQLVAVSLTWLRARWASRYRFEDQKLGDGQVDWFAAPGAQMATRIEGHLAAHDGRLALPVLALARQLVAADQGADPARSKRRCENGFLM